jgi:hypothetical protein
MFMEVETQSADPRVTGGRYFDGYWQLAYTVTAIDGDWLTCAWADGTRTRHCTPWDARRDAVLDVTP